MFEAATHGQICCVARVSDPTLLIMIERLMLLSICLLPISYKTGDFQNLLRQERLKRFT